MTCSYSPPVSHFLSNNSYSRDTFTHHYIPFFMDNQPNSRVSSGNPPSRATTTRPQSISLNSDCYPIPNSVWTPNSPQSSHSFQNKHDSAWSPPQSHYAAQISPTHSFNVYPAAVLRANPNAQRSHHTKSHSRSYSGDYHQHQRRSSQSQGYFPIPQPQSPNSKRRTPSPVGPNTLCSGSSTASSSPPLSPLAFLDALAPVHPLYQGLPRTESGLIPIPFGHRFNRGEIVMTRTTRRLMKTSSTGRLTARHPCLIVESTPTHVRVLQMTSHVNLTLDQVRAVGAELQHWLARDDAQHRDQFGRRGLETSPPSSRAGYIWVGDGGEWVPVEHVKYLTGTRVDEGEIRRLDSLAEYHLTNCPFRAYNEPSP